MPLVQDGGSNQQMYFAYNWEDQRDGNGVGQENLEFILE